MFECQLVASGPVSASPSPTTHATSEVGVVERGAERVRERVAELASLVDRARRLGRDVARDAARERELAEEPAQALFVLADVRIDLAVRALEVRARDEPGPAVPGPCDEDRAEVARADLAVQVRVEEVEPGRRPEMAEQARLDVLRPERLAEQRVVEQVDLSDGEVVRRPPPGVDQPELVLAERLGRRSGRDLRHGEVLPQIGATCGTKPSRSA